MLRLIGYNDRSMVHPEKTKFTSDDLQAELNNHYTTEVPKPSEWYLRDKNWTGFHNFLDSISSNDCSVTVKIFPTKLKITSMLKLVMVWYGLFV